MFNNLIDNLNSNILFWIVILESMFLLILTILLFHKKVNKKVNNTDSYALGKQLIFKTTLFVLYIIGVLWAGSFVSIRQKEWINVLYWLSLIIIPNTIFWLYFVVQFINIIYIKCKYGNNNQQNPKNEIL